jgi:hypothetical protein
VSVSRHRSQTLHIAFGMRHGAENRQLLLDLQQPIRRRSQTKRTCWCSISIQPFIGHGRTELSKTCSDFTRTSTFIDFPKTLMARTLFAKARTLHGIL